MGSSRGVEDVVRQEKSVFTRLGGGSEDHQYKSHSATPSRGYPCLLEVSHHLLNDLTRS